MRGLLAAILSAVLVISTGSVALAHVVVTPKEVAPASFTTFNVSVPNERSVATTEVKLLVPDSLSSVRPTVNNDWRITTEKAGDKVKSITWQGIIPADQRADLSFSAQAPVAETTLEWKAYQTYQDGVVVRWDQQPSGNSDTPFSVSKVTASAAGPSGNTNDASRTANIALLVSVSAIVVSVGGTVLAQRRSGRSIKK